MFLLHNLASQKAHNIGNRKRKEQLNLLFSLHKILKRVKKDVKI